MTRVALRGLLGRKARALLTSFAIVLGVAMISGTFVLTDTIRKSFDGIFDDAYAQTSVVISGKEIVKDSANRATVPVSLLDEVRSLPETATATGDVSGSVKLVDARGKSIAGDDVEGHGFSVDPEEPRSSGLTLTSGRWAAGPDEVVIDAHTASEHGYGIGEPIGAKGDGPLGRYTITGTAELGGQDLGGLVTFAAFDVPTAQRALDRRDGFDAISVAAAPGVSDARLARAVRPLLPAALQVQTAHEAADDESASLDKSIRIIRIFLLVFAGISLFVGAFVIFNTISITVAQRIRELATLRTLGASRRQVLRSVMLETLVIGLVASAVGVVLGLGIAGGLKALFGALGVGLPEGSPVLSGRTVAVALGAGTLVTLLAGLFPALRATAVPPISAVREGAVLPSSRFARLKPYVAGVLTVLGLLAIAAGLSSGGGAQEVLSSLGAGTLLLFTGVAMTSSHLVKPLARIVGLPARRIGGAAGRLAAENSVRNPGRTASTAAALMVGLALVTFVATLGSGLKDAVVGQLDEQVNADYVVSSTADEGQFGKAADAALAKAPGIAIASSVRSDKARILGETTEVVGIDPATIGQVYRFEWERGSAATLSQLGDGAIVDADYAKSNDLTIGSRLRIQTPTGDRRSYTIKATYDAPEVQPLFTGIVISQAEFDAAFPKGQNLVALVDAHGSAAAVSTAGLDQALAAFPDARVDTKDAYVKRRSNDVNTTLALFYVLLALSVIVSLFGMINTMILSVYERTRELGMLRAIGMTGRQARRMVRHESVITALLGAALGLPLGVFLAAIATRGLSSHGIGFQLPVAPLVVFTVVAALAGVLAAISPARRAARLNVLDALKYE
jgi:putative ABC transport system permease protein